jgi:hypothetical protein
MLSEILTSHLKFHLWLRNQLKCLHYIWNPELNKIRPLHGNPPAHLLTVVKIVYSLAQIITVLKYKDEFLLADKLQATLFTVCTLGFLAYRVIWKADSQSVQLINYMCQQKMEKSKQTGNFNN